VTVDYVGSESERDIKSSPAPTVPCKYLHLMPPFR
jgi:hypothetical protein